MYLVERQELEDLGLADPTGNGVVTILSDALNWRPPRPYGRNSMHDEPFMDFETCVYSPSPMFWWLPLSTRTLLMFSPCVPTRLEWSQRTAECKRHVPRTRVAKLYGCRRPPSRPLLRLCHSS